MSHNERLMGDAQHDPSMEEILASIKKVIREDGRAAGQPRPPRRNGRAEPVGRSGDEDVLELDQPLEIGALGNRTLENGAASADAEDDDVQDAELVSENAALASRNALAALATVRASGGAVGATGDQGALEAVVREMLRPMLRDWLDQHLPGIVESLVTREIGRITGRNL